MRLFITICLLLYTCNSGAADIKVFNDRGSHYNPLTYVKTIKTGEGAYTLEFKNDEESYFTNFVVTSTGVIAFDPLSDSAAIEYVKAIKRLAANKPLLAIVYSHLHTDHIAGARILRRAFGQHVPIIAHENVKRYFIFNKVPFIDLPTKTISNKGETIKFGDRTINFHYVGDAHTSSMLVPEVKELKMAYVCDYANNDVVGWTDLPGINIDEMLNMQRKTLLLDVKSITFCHGSPSSKTAINRQLAYYNRLFTVVAKAKQQGLSEDQAAAQIQLPEYKYFANYNDWFKGNVRAVYRWISNKK